MTKEELKAVAAPGPRKQKRWYVVDLYRNDGAKYHIMRGPYKHAETAGAVREEMARHASDAHLGVVWDWQPAKDANG